MFGWNRSGETAGDGHPQRRVVATNPQATFPPEEQTIIVIPTARVTGEMQSLAHSIVRLAETGPVVEKNRAGSNSDVIPSLMHRLAPAISGTVIKG